MAIYRTIALSFWTDSKIDDDFTPEDKYFYLYLLTNPHSNILGCYEISLKQIRIETGYSEETVAKLLDRMQNSHKVIVYDYTFKEILIKNWSKYNWSSSDKYKTSLERLIQDVKNNHFQQFLIKRMQEFYGEEIQIEAEPMYEEIVVEEPKEEKKEIIKEEPKKKQQEPKHKHGEYGNVLLTDEEKEKLEKDYPNADELIKYLDEYIEMKGYKAKSHYLAIRKWVVNAVKEQKNKGKSRYGYVQELPLYMNEKKVDSANASSEDIAEIQDLLKGFKT